MIHTPKQSEAFLQCINALITNEHYKLFECSYKNDLCDSALNRLHNFRVFFPNISEWFNELSTDVRFDYFVLRFDEEEYIDHGFTLEEIVSLINSFTRNLTKDCVNSFTMLEFVKNNYENWDCVLKPVISLNVEEYVRLNIGAGGVTEITRLT